MRVPALVLATMALGSLASIGDTAVGAGKAVGGGPDWQNLFAAAQAASSLAGTALIALRY